MKKLFVYGSLRKGSFNYNKHLKGHILERVMGKTVGSLFHIENKGYPAMIQGDAEIIGEIITLESKELLKAIDAVENYDSITYDTCEYLRKPIKVINQVTDAVEIIDAYVYNMTNKENHKDLLRIVPSGDWLEYIESKENNV
jgi:gamma-glutamylcyclotransferase (GGCT)/AIG2-like uncharacterized protein YtfP